MNEVYPAGIGDKSLSELPGVFKKAAFACIDEFPVEPSYQADAKNELLSGKPLCWVFDGPVTDRCLIPKLEQFLLLEGLQRSSQFDAEKAIQSLQTHFFLFNRDEAKAIISQWRECTREDFEGLDTLNFRFPKFPGTETLLDNEKSVTGAVHDLEQEIINLGEEIKNGLSDQAANTVQEKYNEER